MLRYQKWLLTGWLIILTLGIIGMSIYNLKRSTLLENGLRKEIEEVKKAMSKLKEDVEQIKKEILKPEKTLEIDTSDWKTYKDEKLGVSFKYPKEWSLEKCVSYIKGGFGLNAEKSAFSNPSCNFWIDFVDKNSFYKFNPPLKDYFCNKEWQKYSPYTLGFGETLTCNEIEIRRNEKGLVSDALHCHTISSPHADITIDYCEYFTIFYLYLKNEEYPIFVAGKKWDGECYRKKCKKEDYIGPWGEQKLKELYTCVLNQYGFCREKNKLEIDMFNEFIKTIW
jgi:hypothetical protein